MMNRQGFLETVTNGSMTYPIARNTLTIWELIIQTYAISISSQTGFGRDSSLNSPKNNKNLAPTKQTGPTKQQNVHPKDAFFCFFIARVTFFLCKQDVHAGAFSFLQTTGIRTLDADTSRGFIFFSTADVYEDNDKTKKYEGYMNIVYHPVKVYICTCT